MKPFYAIAYFVCQFILRVVFHLSVKGREHIPRSGPFIAASNHTSFTDPPLIGSLIKREIAFLAKEELFHKIILKDLIKKLNAFPVKRGESSISSVKTCVRILSDQKMPLLIFPEGTRIKTGQLSTPERGISFIAAQTKVPVLPIYVENGERLLQCALFVKRLKLRFGKPILYEDYAPFVKGKKGYLELAQLIMSKIQTLKTEC
ncbi:MAG: lysophospholipid acyltransferase family protein [Candidatus Aminicenantes bacterium]